jgi:lipopolysaccharide/colanic/teichoic acid biosynthesis glycosyltransferase
LIAVWRAFYNRFLSTTFLKTKVIFAGLQPEALELAALLGKQPELGYHVLGVIALAHETNSLRLPQATSLIDLTKKTGDTEIIVVSPTLAKNPGVLGGLYQALFRQTSIVTLDDFYEQILGRVPPFIFSEAWFITNLHEQQKKIYDRARIMFDYVVAISMGVVFIVTFPFVALAIKLTSPGPILFKQIRIGRGETLFTIFKYRTMQALTKNGSAEVDGPQFASVNDARVTAVGMFLRRTRIDELPQFWNILKGQMGLIGPRPERPEFVAELTREMPFYALRHLIKPGLTGWAQLHRSYYGTISENLLKLEYDLYYVKHRSPLLDLSIVLKTINVLVRFMGR